MTDKNKPTDAEQQMAKALQQMKAENQAQAQELAASRRALLDMKADLAFGAAMDASDSRPAARAFGNKLFRQEVRNVRLDRDENVICDIGEMEGVGADAAVAAFIAANDFLQPVGSGDNTEGLDLSKITPTPLDTAAIQPSDSLGRPIPLGDLSADEIFDAAGLPPREHFSGGGEPPDWYRYTDAPSKPKAAPVKPLTDADRELSADEMFERAGAGPEQR